MKKLLVYLAACSISVAIPFGVKAAGFDHPAPKLAVSAIYIAALCKSGFVKWIVPD